MSSTKKAPAPSEVTDLKDGDVCVTANGSIVALLRIPHPFGGEPLPCGLILKGGHGINDDAYDIRGSHVGDLFRMEPDGSFKFSDVEEDPRMKALGENVAKALRLVRRANADDFKDAVAQTSIPQAADIKSRGTVPLINGHKYRLRSGRIEIAAKKDDTDQPFLLSNGLWYYADGHCNLSERGEDMFDAIEDLGAA